MTAERRDDARVAPDEGRILSVHLGHAANCSSIGSFIDMLFVSAAVGAAVLTAVAVLARKEARAEPKADPIRHDDADGPPS